MIFNYFICCICVNDFSIVKKIKRIIIKKQNHRQKKKKRFNEHNDNKIRIKGKKIQ